jgi:hypothetical protein
MYISTYLKRPTNLAKVDFSKSGAGFEAGDLRVYEVDPPDGLDWL